MTGQSKEAKKDVIQIKTGETVALCRCWKSKKFPFCDGTHRKLELEEGPIVVSSKHNE